MCVFHSRPDVTWYLCTTEGKNYPVAIHIMLHVTSIIEFLGTASLKALYSHNITPDPKEPRKYFKSDPKCVLIFQE